MYVNLLFFLGEIPWDGILIRVEPTVTNELVRGAIIIYYLHRPSNVGMMMVMIIAHECREKVDSGVKEIA